MLLQRLPLPAREIARRGQEIYDEQIRSRVETDENRGKVIVINIETGDYEIDADHLAASGRARAHRPGAVLFATRIGFPTLSRRGGYQVAERVEDNERA